MSKQYGYRYIQSAVFSQPERVLCAGCYSRAYGSIGGRPSPRVRRLLGIEPVTTYLAARMACCDTCRRTLA